MSDFQKKKGLPCRKHLQKFCAERGCTRTLCASLFSTALFITSMGFCEKSYALDTARASAFIYEDVKLVQPSTFKQFPSPVLADPCLPLLQKVDPVTNRNQRPAGTQAAPAVALGFVFGLRVALGPKEALHDRRPVRTSLRTGAQFGRELLTRDDGKKSALSVANYRRCKNKQALKELNVNWRLKGSR